MATGVSAGVRRSEGWVCVFVFVLGVLVTRLVPFRGVTENVSTRRLLRGDGSSMGPYRGVGGVSRSICDCGGVDGGIMQWMYAVVSTGVKAEATVAREVLLAVTVSVSAAESWFPWQRSVSITVAVCLL